MKEKAEIQHQRERADQLFPYWRELVEYKEGYTIRECENEWLQNTLNIMRKNEAAAKVNKNV